MESWPQSPEFRINPENFRTCNGHLVYLAWFYHLLTIFKINSFRNPIRLSNRLDPDQDRHFVGPDLGPNYL